MPKMSHTWSNYQEAIFAASVATPLRSLLINAVAGSGKTTTLEEAARRVPESICLAVAFNKRIQVELEKRLPQKFKCRTFNSLGHSAWQAMVRPRLTVDDGKLFSILKTMDIEDKEDFVPIIAMVNAARNHGLVPTGSSGNPRGLIPDTKEEWEELADYYEIEWSDFIYEKAREALRECITLSFRGQIDFADQVYMSVCWNGSFTKNQLILVDEAQDLSEIQHEMLRRSLIPGGRIIAVGDRNQAIYGFRGASQNSMDKLKQAFAMHELPLSVSFRCARDIVAEARAIVPHIEPAPTSPRGTVERLNSMLPSDFHRPSAVVCRNTAPLVSVAFKLIRSGIGVKFLGKDIGKGLRRIAEKLCPYEVSQEEFQLKLDMWATQEARKKPKQAEAIHDKKAALAAISEHCRTSTEVLKSIDKLFADSDALITLSTVHKSKGLEWDTVYFLDEWLIPSKRATQPWQIEQEYNLRYVAITRAKQRLVYVNAADVTTADVDGEFKTAMKQSLKELTGAVLDNTNDEWLDTNKPEPLDNTTAPDIMGCIFWRGIYGQS